MYKWNQKKVFVYLLLLVILSILDISACDSPAVFFRKDYTLLSEFGGFYKVHNARQNFSDAITTCSAEGGSLLLPSSKKELQAIFKLAKPTVTHFYIGIHDTFSEGNFVTLDGIPIEEIYHEWRSGEPNNNFDNEDCVVVLKEDVTYNDGNCATKENFVCRKDMYTVTENPNCETYDLNYFYIFELDRCYKLHTTPRNWRDAFRICRAEESDLVIINSESEAQMLVSKMQEYPESKLAGNFHKGIMHVGFQDMFNEGVHLTVDGKLLSDSGYEKWSVFQPDDQLGSEDCGSIFRDGTLNDVNCDDVRAFFVCEKALTSSFAPITKKTFAPKLPLVIETKPNHHQLPDE